MQLELENIIQTRNNKEAKESFSLASLFFNSTPPQWP